MSFRITGLPAEDFATLFALSDEELAREGAVRQIADGRVPGYPCRVSLTDARAGDELLLVNYEHHPVSSPYRMRFAVYVRKGERTYDAIDEVPEQLRIRTLAVRAFNADAMMVGWELVDGISWRLRSNGSSPIPGRHICTSTMRRLDVTPHGSTAPEGRDPSPIPSGSSITKAEFAYCCFSAPFDVATFGEGELQGLIVRAIALTQNVPHWRAISAGLCANFVGVGLGIAAAALVIDMLTGLLSTKRRRAVSE